MASGGNVKRGFGVYLLILLFMVILAFFVIVAILMLSPSTTILGFKYFVQRDSYALSKTSIDEDINYETLQELDINCGYSNIEIIRSSKIEKPDIVISLNTYGFAKEKNNTDFTCKTSFVEGDTTKLSLEISEPSGFLFLSKDITITYRVPCSSATSFEHINLNVVNGSGRLVLGNSIEIQNFETNINFSSVNFKTNNGTLIINKFVGDQINKLFFKSEAGGIQNYKDLTVNNRLQIFSTKGNLKLGSINYNGSEDIKMELNNSKLTASQITGNVLLDINGGYVDVDKLVGNLNSGDALNQMGRATINIKEVDGNISLPYSNSAILHFGKLTEGKQAYINGTTGNIVIDEINGACWIETTKGNVSVKTNSNDIWVKTQTGNIYVEYNNNEILDKLDFISEKGSVNLKVKSELKFILKVYNSKGELRSSSNIKIEFYDKNFQNPLVINEGTKFINITTNSKVYISLL